MKPRTLATLAALVLALYATAAHAEGFWQWSPQAPHHAAAVMVRQGKLAASGVYVTHKGKAGVLTCAHLFKTGDPVSVTFSDGTTTNAEGTVDKFQHDVAWVFATNKNIHPLALAVSAPTRGQRVEFVTYGGPVDSLRHWYATAAKDGGFASYVIPGDSGGAILNANHQVVGIQSVGFQQAGTFRDDNGKVWPLLAGSSSAPTQAIVDFCDRVCCPQGFCPNPYQQPTPPIQLYPPGTQPQPQPQPPPQLPPEVTVEVDYNKLAALVLAEMKRNPEPFRGPAGRDGQNGQDGRNGTNGTNGTDGKPGQDAVVDYNTLAEQVANRLPPIRVVQEAGKGGTPLEQSVPLGGTLRLPPVRMEIQHPDGQVYYQEKPLGGVIAIKLVPKGN